MDESLDEIPNIDDEIPVVECHPVSQNSDKSHRQRRPSRAVLGRAMLVQTFVLLSAWALTHQSQDSRASYIASAASTGETIQNRAQHDENWPGGEKELEQYRNLDQEFRQQGRGRNSHQFFKDEQDGVIVISMVDGTMAGLCRKTGKTLWKQSPPSDAKGGLFGRVDRRDDTSQHMRPHKEKKNQRVNPDRGQLLKPLVSTTTTTKSSSSGQDWRTAAVPSVDGRVFLTAGRDGSGSPSPNSVREVTATTTVRELVGRAPFVDSRGHFYVGSRDATAAALDRDTGEVLRVVSGSVHNVQGDQSLEDRNIVWVGRVDYSVSVYDARTGETDVQFSTSEIMSVNDMQYGTLDGGGAKQVSNSQHAPRLMLPSGASGDSLYSSQSLLVATPSGHVALRNPDTGQIEWVASETFESTVAFAVESSTGSSLGVDILPDATVPSSSTEYLSAELERQAEALNNQDDNEISGDEGQPIVGALPNGQLFAMPLGKRHTSSALSTALGLPQSHSIASSSSTMGSSRQMVKLPDIFGRPFHDSSQKTGKKACNPTIPGYPGCLVPKGDDFSSNFLGQSLHGNPFGDNAIVNLQYHPGLGYLPSAELPSQQHKLKKAMKIMASWLPPTMALIFVLSFELGRRQRIREERKKEERERRIANSAAQEAQSRRKEENSNGVIQVSDEVLGYGGHGTVVYKGTLDGRKVAVKRMLEAYQSSADREISLLISSDGHPNVVRYFLKEVRGDFVYLALELCDMSLHDLICVLGSRKTYLERSTILPATKATLHQIASGVRHLHSLRIVHRDLKPANILLAQSGKLGGSLGESFFTTTADHKSDESVYPAFERGEYIAKISDMGLGKQLAGQSSFGISTLANSSLNALANASREGIVGAGPGSVGWQAPEVMALRWSPESMAPRTESSSFGGNDSFAEASPLEGSVNARTSRSVDIFSLGCIFYCTLVPGSHPFGEWYEREANIMKNKPSIEALKNHSADAYDLVKSMINRDPKARPTAKQIVEHPFFWGAARRLMFLCDVSDRLECDAAREEAGDTSTEACLQSLAIERNASRVVGTAWDRKLDPELVNNVSKFRTYDPSSVRDCLRLIRNKHHHYDELSPYVKSQVGTNPKGFLEYFESRFPSLLMHCYSTCRDFLPETDSLIGKYRIRTRSSIKERTVQKTKLKEIPTAYEEKEEKTEDVGETYVVVKDLTPPSDDKDEIEDDDRIDSDPVIVKEDDPSFELLPGEVISEKEDECDTPVSTSLDDSAPSPPSVSIHEEVQEVPALKPDDTSSAPEVPTDIVVWEGSTAAKTLNCRGWMRSSDEWIRRTDASLRKRDANIARCAGDAKFRTRLCNHWDASWGTFCPMKRKNKCVFAHGPVELRVKAGKLHRWGKLVDKDGNNSNPKHSGGEDTYGAARSIETVRKEEGKWNTDKSKGKKKGRQGGGGGGKR